MSKWEDKSDPEINESVKALLLEKHDKESDFELFFLDILKMSSFDYCNDAAHAWYIITDNKISIEFRDHKSLSPIAKRFGSDSHNVAHGNPLRAAMIVFLEMNGVKPNE